MIIDEIIDTYKARKEWDKLSYAEKWSTGYDRPIMDFKYVKNEAKLFEFNDIYNAIHILPSGIIVNDGAELRKALHNYVDEQGYAPAVHDMVETLEL